MADRRTIWSGAFGEMVGGELRSLSDRNAGPIRAVWPTLVVDCLTKNQWPWTLRRTNLTQTRNDPEGSPRSDPFLYRYALPAKTVVGEDGAGTGGRIGAGALAVYDRPDAEEQTDQSWELRGTAIYTDMSRCSILHQFHAPEEDWPDEFAEWVRLRICQATVGTYGNPARVAEFRSMAKEQFGDVVNAVAQVVHPRRLVDRWATTAGRAGFELRPLQLNADGFAE